MSRWGMWLGSWLITAPAWAASNDVPPLPPATEPAPPAAQPPLLVDGPALAAELAKPTGHVRVVNFWATWCQPCVTELPTLKAFAKAHPEVELVLVNVDAQSSHASRVTRAFATYKLEGLHHWWLATDDPERLLKANVPRWASEIPFTLVIDGDGVLREHFIDAITSAMLDRAVTQARIKPTTPAGG